MNALCPSPSLKATLFFLPNAYLLPPSMPRLQVSALCLLRLHLPSSDRAPSRKVLFLCVIHISKLLFLHPQLYTDLDFFPLPLTEADGIVCSLHFNVVCPVEVSLSPTLFSSLLPPVDAVYLKPSQLHPHTFDFPPLASAFRLHPSSPCISDSGARPSGRTSRSVKLTGMRGSPAHRDAL